jgi:hypothetical protein
MGDIHTGIHTTDCLSGVRRLGSRHMVYRRLGNGGEFDTFYHFPS